MLQRISGFPENLPVGPLRGLPQERPNQRQTAKPPQHCRPTGDRGIRPISTTDHSQIAACLVIRAILPWVLNVPKQYVFKRVKSIAAANTTAGNNKMKAIHSDFSQFFTSLNIRQLSAREKQARRDVGSFNQGPTSTFLRR